MNNGEVTQAALKPVEGVNYPSVTRLDSLDFLRGLCALAVVIFHFHSWGGLKFPEAWEGFLAVCGTYGVSVFFVLSGYSLAHGYGDKFSDGIKVDAVLRYSRRRIARLMPLFGLVVLASIAGKMLTGAAVPDVFTILANLLLVFGFVDPALSPVIGGWSIGIEVVFYVAFPLLIVMRRYAVIVVAISVFLSAWLSSIVAAQGSLEAAWVDYVSPANHMVFFATGAYAGFYLRRKPQWAPVAGLLGIACILSLIWIISAGADELAVVTGLRRALLVLLSVFLVVVTSRISMSGNPLFASLFGAASYPLYLIHPLVYFLGARFLPQATMLFLFLLLASIVLALLVDLVIDKPLQRRLKSAGW